METIGKYELALLTHSDDFIMLLHGQLPFDGEAYDVKLIKKANGEETLTFSLPLFIMNTSTLVLEENSAWHHIISEQKIRLIRNRSAALMADKDIHDFVIKSYTESRDDSSITLNIETKSYSLYELGKIGYGAIFDQDTLYNDIENNIIPDGTISTINYWMDKILPWTKNEYNVSTNTDGWNHTPITLYEKNDVLDYVETVPGNGIWVPVESGVPVEKGRIIKIEKSNVFNMIQDLAEKFEVWPTFTYTYDPLTYKTIGRTISFTEEIETDSLYSIVYGVNIQNIARTIDGNSFITKMYVEKIDSEFDSDGLMSISNAPQNKMMTEFLYNFDYLVTNNLVPAGFTTAFETLKNYVRTKNIVAKVADNNIINKELEKINVDAELTTVTFANNAIGESVSLLLQQVNASPGPVTYNSIFSIVKNGIYWEVDLGKEGIYSFTSMKRQADNATIAVQAGNYMYNAEDPASIDYLRFDSDPTGNGTYMVVIEFIYNPKRFLTTLYNKEYARSLSLIARKAYLTAQVAAIQSLIDGYEITSHAALADVTSAINTFEGTYPYAIKEGSWRDSEYILRREEETVTNQTVANTEANITGFIFTNNSNNADLSISYSQVDLTSIHIWHSTYKYEYFNFADFEIRFGDISDVKGIVIVPVNTGSFLNNRLIGADDTRLANISSVIIKYKDLSGNEYTNVLDKNINITHYTQRSITLTNSNILPESLSIVPVNGQTPLTPSTDFYYSLATDGAVILLKDTNATKPLANPYTSISYNTNNSVKFFFYDANEVLIRSSQPQVSYELSIVDLSGLDDYAEFVPVIGQRVPIRDLELKFISETGFISEIAFDLDNPENTQVTISNYKTKFEDLFQRIMAATEQISARADSYDRVADVITPRGIISGDVLQNTLAESVITIANSADNSYTIDKSGITLTDNSNRYLVSAIVKIVGNGIFLSNSVDNGGNRIWGAAITGGGINASKMTLGALDTKKVSIWSSKEPRFLWNEDGLYAYGYKIESDELKTDFNSFVRLNGKGLYFQYNTGTIDIPVFYDAVVLNWDGLTIQSQAGAVKLTSISGLQVFDGSAQERVQLGKLTGSSNYGLRLRDSANAIVMETDSTGKLWLKDQLLVGSGTSSVGLWGGGTTTGIAIWAGDTFANRATAHFRVDYEGNLVAESATISGNISATTGSIGGFTIAATSLTGTNFVLDTAAKRLSLGSANNIVITDADEGFWVGHANFASAPFSVSLAGALNATNATISGAITATSGGIGGFTISATALTGTNFVLDTSAKRLSLGSGNSIFIADADEGIWLGNAAKASAPFAVGLDGSLIATNATITGTINASLGGIGGFTISATALTGTNFVLDTDAKKLSLGSGNNIIISDADEGFWIGHAAYASAPFKVDLSGGLTATGVSISGSITATGGTIGGFTISSTALTGTNFTLDTSAKRLSLGATNSIFIADADEGIWLGNAAMASANFKVTLSGALTAVSATLTSADVSGTINASAGTFSNSVYIGATSNRIVLDGTNKIVKSENYSKDVAGWAIDGTGFAEFESVLVRGAFKSSVFVYDEINAQGGTLMIAESAATYSSLSKVSDTVLNGLRVRKTYSTQPYMFAVNDTLRIQVYISATVKIILWLKVSTQVSNATGDYAEYNCSILAGSTTGNFTLPAGTAVVNYGVSGTGYIIMRADDGSRGSYIKMVENITTNVHIPGDQKVQLVLGDLAGETDSLMGSLSGYGLYAQNAYLTGTVALPSAGITNLGSLGSDIRIWSGATMANRATAPFRVSQDGTMTLRGNGSDQMVFNPTTGVISFGSGVTINWSSINNPPTIYDEYQVLIYGNHIQLGDANTTLSVLVYKNGADITSAITDPLKLEWFVGNSGTAHGTGKTQVFLASEITISAQIKCIYTP